MNLSQIHTFMEVAKTGSFVQAGLRMSIPRSTVSARVRALEERLNVRLLHRTTRQVSFTNEGEAYFEKCAQALAILTEAEQAFHQSGELVGKIRLSAPVDISKRSLSKVLFDFSKLHPLVQVEVIIGDDALDMLENNIDLALRGKTPGKIGLTARRLSEGIMALYASPQYFQDQQLLEQGNRVAGHVVFDPTGKGKNLFDAGGGRPKVQSQNFEFAKACAMASKGLALLPEAICQNEVLNGRLVRVASDAKFQNLPLYIVMPTKKLLPIRVRAMVDFLVAANERSMIL